MKIRVMCSKHNGAAVIPADARFTWLQAPEHYETNPQILTQTDPEKYYDASDLYCTGTVIGDTPNETWEHEFWMVVVLEGTEDFDFFACAREGKPHAMAQFRLEA